MNKRITFELLEALGLTRLPPFYRDPHFAFVLAAAGVVLVMMRLWEPISAPTPWQESWLLLLGFTLWQPLVEELLFRGLVQGQLLRLSRGGRARYGVTPANAITSLLFTSLHFFHHPPLWAAAVIVPSVLFGYFRERHHSVYPAVALHVLFNGGYALTVLI